MVTHFSCALCACIYVHWQCILNYCAEKLQARLYYRLGVDIFHVLVRMYQQVLLQV